MKGLRKGRAAPEFQATPLDEAGGREPSWEPMPIQFQKNFRRLQFLQLRIAIQRRNGPSTPVLSRWRRTGGILPVLGLLGALLSAPRLARANSGKPFLETIGTSIAVGTVLGASTLPFYDQPSSHLTNVAAGAGLGVVVGMGIYLSGLIGGSADNEGYGLEDTTPRSKPPSTANPFSLAATSTSSAKRDPRNAYPPLVWTPLVSFNW